MIRPSILALLPLLLAPPGTSSEGPASPERPSRHELRQRANELDRLVAADLARRGARPGAIVDDATFLRRTTLAIAGRIPTLAEEEAFRADRSSTKRHDLVDRLAAGRGYESSMFHWFADLLRIRTKLARYTSGEPYVHYVKEAIATDRPYDVVVRELLTATGPAHREGNGATGYRLRDRGMPEDNTANTARVFLGTRIECAQCHDHPFTDWKQRDFFRLVAFGGGVEDVHDEPPSDRLRAFGRELRRVGDADERRGFRRMIRPVATGVSGSGTGVAALPDDYRYDDAEPGALVRAAPLFGPDVPLDGLAAEPDLERPRGRKRNVRRGRKKDPAAVFPEIGSREAFAEWVTAPENPRFTTVVANRMWKRVFGVGLIEPVDDLRDDTVPSDPALMAALERLMKDVGYDLRAFQRVLWHTDLWQREAAPLDATAPGGPAFVGPALRRLSAEQLWDSLVTLIVPDVDATLAAPDEGAREVYARFDEALAWTDDDLRERLELETLRRTDRKAYQRARARERAEARAHDREVRKLAKRLERARQRERTRRVADLEARLAQLGVSTAEVEQAVRGRGLERASDLPSPVDPGHFLWQFGQSEREQVEAGHREANVPQVLNLLNGFVEEELLSRENSEVLLATAAARTPDETVDVAWRAVLARAPSADERATWRDDVATRGTPAVHDLLWTLLNSHEFLFLR
ncbi:MAG: DUF1549 domain-containing protein [Planctomycetota bacterium JB042]